MAAAATADNGQDEHVVTRFGGFFHGRLMGAAMAEIPLGNGCDFWPEGLFGLDWTRCCDLHDFQYTAGGNLLDKFAADAALRACVDQVLPGMGVVMFVGVSLGGWLFFRWRRRAR
jgi:hypothetical protein